MARLINVEGIGEVYAKKLMEIGIETTEQLLVKGKTPRLREELAEASGISAKLLLKWLNRADLFRVKGIGEEYSDLLEAAGVDTVPELAQRKAENLHQKMVEVNDVKKLVRRLPGADQVASWVEQAKTLPRVLEY